MGCVCMFNSLWLCDSMDSNPPGSSVRGISQARKLEWVAMSSSWGSSRPTDQACVSCFGRLILYHWATWEVPCKLVPCSKTFSVLGCHDSFCRVTLQILLYVHCFQFLCKHSLLKLMWAIHFPWGCNVESHLLFLLCHLPHLEHLPQLYPSLLLIVFQGIT